MMRMMRWMGALVVALLGCSGHKLPAKEASLGRSGDSPSEFVAGSAFVDVTPPPGVSMFGHGPGALVAFGYWTRLGCRAFTFEKSTEADDVFALVSCDLPVIGTLLHRSVAEIVSISAARLMIAATHTHAGPGHYIESESFGGLGSTTFPGFDGAMVDFLAKRIASAIESARKRGRPARLRWIKREVWGLTRNRSPLPHAANEHPALWPPPARIAKRDYAYQAIDPFLRVLQIEAVDEIQNQPREIGSLAFFAMHPTVIGNQNRFLGGDVFGVTTRVVESSREEGTVHALFNTNEGDMSPAWVLGTPGETVRIGTELADAILAALRTPVDPDVADDGGKKGQPSAWNSRPSLGMRYFEEHMPGAPYFAAPGGLVEKVCPFPVLGFNAMLGASDHPTVFDGLIAGLVHRGKPAGDCQHPKRPLLSRLWRLAATNKQFPKDVPLGLVRIDSTWLSFVPGEPTITAGKQINDAVLEVAKTAVGPGEHADAAVVGLANGYLMYVATPKEYALQHYEGAATLYGPHTSTLLSKRYAYLALHLAQPGTGSRPTAGREREVDQVGEITYHTGSARERLWRDEWDVPIEKLGSQRRPEGLCRMPSGSTPVFCGWWVDGGPAAVRIDEGVYVEVLGCSAAGCEPATLGVNDLGMEFHTRVHGSVGDGWRWSTVFHPSRETWERIASNDRIILRVRGRGAVVPLDLPDFSGVRSCRGEELRTLCSAPL